jgi:hypothetical protein
MLNGKLPEAETCLEPFRKVKENLRVLKTKSASTKLKAEQANNAWEARRS